MREKLGARLMELTRSGVTAIWEMGTSAARNIVEGLGTFFSGIGRLFTGGWKDGFKELGLGLLKIFIQTPIDGILLGGGKYLSAIQTITWIESLGRRLNPDELDELYKVYRDSVDYKRVRVKVNKKRSEVFGLRDRWFTLGNTIYMMDLTGAKFLRELVHEVAHVWQFQHGGSEYLSEAVWSQFFGKGYDWCRSVPGTKWRDLEPGNTPRLDRSELATYYWIFQNPSGIGVSVSGTPIPYYIDFNAGIRGHLRVRFTAKGKDAWEKDWIRSNVFFGELRHVPRTIDSMVWVEDWETFFFGRDVVLSTEKSDEGYASLTLLY